MNALVSPPSAAIYGWWSQPWPSEATAPNEPGKRHLSPGVTSGIRLAAHVVPKYGTQCPCRSVPYTRPTYLVTLPEGREHVVANVSFIAEPVARVGREEHSGFSKAMVIMAASSDRVGDPGQASGNSAGDLYVHSGRLTLPGVQFRVRPSRPAREQCAVHDVACSDVEFIGRGDVVE